VPPAPTARTSILRFAFLAFLLAGLVAVPAGMSWADPTPTPAEAAAQVQALQLKMQRATETYDTAREKLVRLNKQAVVLRRQTAAQQAQVNRYRDVVDAMAAAAYRSGNISEFSSLLSSGSPQTFLDQLATLDHIGSGQRDQIRQLVQAKRDLDQATATLSAARSSQQQTTAELGRSKQGIERDLAHWRKLKAQVQPRPVVNAPAPTATGRGASAPASYTGPASGRAAVALRTAYAQMGKPYQYGAAGPNSFDCSGLTMYSWRAAGVSLPHSSSMQSRSGRQVSRSDLQPGDLVFFGSPISHVGIFVSGDTIIGAPTTGDVVRYQSISGMGMPYAGAVRP
jgi:cell wall-associated NlpC family hydrolase